MAKGVIPEAAKGLSKASKAADKALEGGGEELGRGAETVGEKAVSALGLTGKGSEALGAAGKFAGGAVQGVGGLAKDVGSFFYSPDNVQPTAQLGPGSLEYLKEQKQKQAAKDKGPGEKPPGGSESFPEQAQKLIGTATPTITSIATDISQILGPYMQQLGQLGPEYQNEMQYLAPYVQQTGAQAPQSFAQIKAQSEADMSPTGSKSVNAADAALGSALESQAPPGFGNAAQQVGQYVSSIPEQGPLQAAVQYQQYLQKYGQLQPQGLDPQAQGAYQFLTGNSPGGAGSVNQAAAGAQAAKTLGINQPSPGGTGA